MEVADKDPRLEDPRYQNVGSGIGHQTGAWEVKDHLRIMKAYTTPRGTHSLGIAFSSKLPKREKDEKEQ